MKKVMLLKGNITPFDGYLMDKELSIKLLVAEKELEIYKKAVLRLLNKTTNKRG